MDTVLRDSDDAPVGRILRRREVLALLGASGAAIVAACVPTPGASPAPTAAGTAPAPATGAAATTPAAGTAAATPGAVAALPSCIVRPELTEGPFFVDEKLDRSDIRADPSRGAVKPGALLALTFNVSRITAGACRTLAGAVVDVWHCDALGVYSDVSDPRNDTRGQKFLRGSQATDANGVAKFTTIYPGWYQGRAVHIHFKIRTVDAGERASDLTSQLFFDEKVNDEVFSRAPYAQKTGIRVRNDADGIFRNNGAQLLLTPAKTATGYTATFDIGLA